MRIDPAPTRVPRPAARILLVDAQGRVLLMRFTPADRPPLWCTPGGAVDPGESYAAAARRELWEEVGLDIDCGPEVARRVVDFVTFEGVAVNADERYFRVDVDACEVRAAALTPLERRVLAGWRWFETHELADWPETIYPQDLADLLDRTKGTSCSMISSNAP
ncbi:MULTISPECIES: NUDIX hydrolase [unclassified Sphingomonas]|jgi:8-oxo-dGTP diphosphatase|nr:MULTISPECIES: NUDIX domain-containing protein [unclassified Sphingomonas]AXJ96871.1 DNA mismatch repair protein MutT [Sphingomonas sp. FARSPH]